MLQIIKPLAVANRIAKAPKRKDLDLSRMAFSVDIAAHNHIGIVKTTSRAIILLYYI